MTDQEPPEPREAVRVPHLVPCNLPDSRPADHDQAPGLRFPAAAPFRSKPEEKP